MSSTDISKLFRKNSDGSWTCTTPTYLTGSLVRVRIGSGMTFVPGRQFLGVDVVAALDDNTANIFDKAGEDVFHYTQVV